MNNTKYNRIFVEKSLYYYASLINYYYRLLEEWNHKIVYQIFNLKTYYLIRYFRINVKYKKNSMKEKNNFLNLIKQSEKAKFIELFYDKKANDIEVPNDKTILYIRANDRKI